MSEKIVSVQSAVVAIQASAVKGARDPPTSLPQPPSPESPTDVHKNGVIYNVDARLQQRWNRTKYAELGIPDHYTSVAVLIIHWDRELDEDLNCGPQVEELHELFENDFGFQSKVIALENTKRPPQNQLDKALVDFVYDNDGPHRSHLLIVYYTGHGFTHRRDNSELMISGTVNGDSKASDANFPPYASWPQSELVLDRARADTLIILDCCSASNIMKGMSDQPRTYELMAATPKDGPAPSGAKSYTAALITSLRTLLHRSSDPFSTHALNQEIIKQRGWNTDSQLWNRRPGPRTRHICIGRPAKPAAFTTNKTEINTSTSTTDPSHTPLPRAGYLDLRVSFTNNTTLNIAQVDKLASELCKLSKRTDLSICDLEWLKFTPCKDSILVRILWARWLFRKAMMRFKTKKHKRALGRELLDEGIPALKRRRVDSGAVGNGGRERDFGAEGDVAVEVGGNAQERPPLTPSCSSRGATPGSFS